MKIRCWIQIAAVLSCCLNLAEVNLGQQRNPLTENPSPMESLGAMAEKLKGFDVVLEPDQDEAEWWAGAPSVVRDAGGIFWMACRMRTADAPRGLRGYEVRILRSEDGIHFEKVHAIPREKVPIPGFERPALLMDPVSGKFKLYGCGPWKGGPWTILKWEDCTDPRDLDPSSARPVIAPAPRVSERDTAVRGYKDPVILYAEGAFHCYVIGQVRDSERIYHFRSLDGIEWQPVGHPMKSLLPLSGWHDFFVRPASVLPLGPGYLFLYEGSSTTWHDPVYNIATGLGFTFDLHHIVDITPEAPMAVSSTPGPLFSTWRYSDWIHVGDEIWAYAEVAKPNGANNVRLFRFAR